MYNKLTPNIQRKFETSIRIFYRNPFDVQLRNHSLYGTWSGFRSINITGDWRAIYLPISNNVAQFYAIGTHGQLYK